MAYITLSARDFARLDNLAREAGINEHEAAGRVAILWHEAQSAARDEGTSEEIATWSHVRTTPVTYMKGWLAALHKCEYVEPIEEDRWRIRDMGRQLNNLVRSRGRKALEKNSNPLPSASGHPTPASPPPAASSFVSRIVVDPSKSSKVSGDAPTADFANTPNVETHESSVKEEALLFGNDEERTVDASPKKKKTRSAKPKVAKPISEGSEVFEAYSVAFFLRYKIQPVRNAASNAICASLVRDYGREKAKDIVDSYVTRNDSFYTLNRHPLTLCKRDAHKLLTDIETGDKMTVQRARKHEAHADTNEAIERYIEATEAHDNGEA